jgi:ssDNA-binding Zn-finger/Zn-ribbon topoisomerase 1
LDIKRKNGQFIGSFAGYGYLKDPADKNHLIIDEVAAEIVRMIFGLRLDGFSSQRIAFRLNEMKVVPPYEYKRMCGLNFNSGFRSGDSPKWTTVTINRILKNELYIGTLVQGKRKKINYKVKEIREVDEANWIRVENTHEAIIPKPVYENVQHLLKLDTRTSPQEECVYLFSGFLKCADCGQNMVRRTSTKNGKKYYYYHCSTYKNKDGCSSHLVSEETLKKVVFSTVQSEIGVLVEADEILSKIDRLPQEQLGVRTINTQLASLSQEIERYKDLRAKLYQDRLDGIVGNEEYRDIDDRFTEKINAAKEAVAENERKRERLLSRDSNLRPWMEEFKKYRNVEQLDRKMIATIIDRIVVLDKTQIEIHFRYENEIQEMFAWLAELEDRNKTQGRKVAVG